MSDISRDLDRVEAGLTPGRPLTRAELADLERKRALASRCLWKNAYDLYEMVLGVPVPCVGGAR